MPTLLNTHTHTHARVHTHTHTPHTSVSVYVTCFPRTCWEQGQMHLLLLPFRAWFHRTPRTTTPVWTSWQCFWACVGRQIHPAGIWHFPACVLDRMLSRHLRPHRGTASITPVLHFLPAPRSWPLPNQVVQVKLTKAPCARKWDQKRPTSHLPAVALSQRSSVLA